MSVLSWSNTNMSKEQLENGKLSAEYRLICFHLWCISEQTKKLTRVPPIHTHAQKAHIKL